MSQATPSTDRITVIQPRKGWIALNLGELWRERDLLYFFIWRDMKVRYRQTLLGFTWALINPIVNTGIFTIIFGNVAHLPTGGLPAPIFYIIGLTIWRYFAATLAGVSNCLVGNASVVTKIYFPRLLLALNACITGLAEYGIALGLVVLCMLLTPGEVKTGNGGERAGAAAAGRVIAPGDMLRVDVRTSATASADLKVDSRGIVMLPNAGEMQAAGKTASQLEQEARNRYAPLAGTMEVKVAMPHERRFFQYAPAWTTLLLPVLILLAMSSALGVGLFFAALNVRYRDVGQFVPFLTQIWMYLTIILPFSALPARWGMLRYAYALNPMVGVVEGARWLIAHNAMPGVPPPFLLIALGFPFIIVTLSFGLHSFKRAEKLFADIV